MSNSGKSSTDNFGKGEPRPLSDSGYMTRFTLLDYIRFRWHKRRPGLLLAALILVSWQSHQPISGTLYFLNFGIAVSITFLGVNVFYFGIGSDFLKSQRRRLWIPKSGGLDLIFTLLPFGLLGIFVATFLFAQWTLVSLPAFFRNALRNIGLLHIDPDLFSILCVLLLVAVSCVAGATVAKRMVDRSEHPFEKVYLLRWISSLYENAWLYLTIAVAFIPPVISLGAWQPNLIAAVLVPMLVTDFRRRIGGKFASAYYRRLRNSNSLQPNPPGFILATGWTIFPVFVLGSVIYAVVAIYSLAIGSFENFYFGLSGFILMVLLADYVAQYISLKKPAARARLLREISRPPGEGLVAFSSKQTRDIGLSIARSGDYIHLYTAEALDLLLSPAEINAILKDLVRCSEDNSGVSET